MVRLLNKRKKKSGSVWIPSTRCHTCCNWALCVPLACWRSWLATLARLRRSFLHQRGSSTWAALGLAANYEFGSHSGALPGGGKHFVVALKATKGLGRCPPLRSIEPEIVAKLACTGCRIYEAGISYSGRTYAEGKKVRWKDGVRAIYVILKYNLKRRHVIERR
jgi:hypothetical protein